MGPGFGGRDVRPRLQPAVGRLISTGGATLLLVASLGLYPASAVAESLSQAPPSTGSATAGQDAGAIVRLPGHTLDLSSYTPLAPSPDSESQPLMITVVLRRTDQAGFEAYLSAIADPNSPDHGRLLSQQELADRFGPSQQAYDAVLAYLQGYDFRLLMGAPNRLTLSFQATRSEAEQAFHVAIRDYQSGNRVFYANDGDPGLPASIAPTIMAVVGLDNLAVPRSS
jgi:hypothetical protein